MRSHRARGAFAAACLSLLGATVLSGGGAAPAGAVQSFPGQGFLPNDRAWEMVSPAEKNGSYAVPISVRTRAAADGSALGFIALAAFGDAVGAGVAVDYMSRRTAVPGTRGWSIHAITPPQQPNTLDGIFSALEPFYAGEFSPDLRRGVFFARSPLTDDKNVEDTINLYLRSDLLSPGAGSYQLITACPHCAKTDTPLPPLTGTTSDFRFRPDIAGTSPDLEHLIFESAHRLTKDTPPPADPNAPLRQLYEWQDGQVRLAGRIPKAPAIACDDAVAPACGTYPVTIGGQGSPNGTRLTPHTVSDGSDGHSRVFFTTPTDAAGTIPSPDSPAGNLYVRVDGHETAKLNAPEPGAPADSFSPARYFDATPDGTLAYFVTAQALTDDAPADGQAKLYSYETTKSASAPDNLTFLSPDTETDDQGEVLGLIGASEDGSRAYFVARGQLVAGESKLEGDHAIYLWQEGELRLVGPLGPGNSSTSAELLSISPSAALAPRQARLSADGSRLLFSSTIGTGLLSRYGGVDYDHGGCDTSLAKSCRELYLYDAEAEGLQCVSCRPDGAPATAVPADAMASTVVKRFFGGTQNQVTHQTRALSADGRYVFFSTAEKLLAADTNGVEDAYLFDSATGRPHLLSSGEDSFPSFFLDASADGSNAFVVTAEPLSGWDVDHAYDVYDARVGGGFPEPAPAPPGCQGDACQPAPRDLSAATPGTAGLNGPGDRSERRRPRCAKGKRRVRARNGKQRCVKRKAKRAAGGERRRGR